MRETPGSPSGRRTERNALRLHLKTPSIYLMTTCLMLVSYDANTTPSPKQEPAMLPTLPRSVGPGGIGAGPLSTRFPEVNTKVTSSFAHDRGMMNRVESISVAGQPCTTNQVLQMLVAHRKGWTQSGGSADAEVVATMRAFADDWSAMLPNSGRLTSKTPPRHASSQHMTHGYHPPMVELYRLTDGDKVVVHTYFVAWDGGTHGRQYGLNAESYRVSTGALFSNDLWLGQLNASGPIGPPPPKDETLKLVIIPTAGEN